MKEVVGSNMIVKGRALETGEYGTETQDILTLKRHKSEQNRKGNILGKRRSVESFSHKSKGTSQIRFYKFCLEHYKQV